VDDDVKHNGPAFNDALADAGYTVDVVASDGYMVSFDSARVKRNDNIIVANTVNGNPLPDKYYPLRLVGSDLKNNEMAGMIAKIVVHLKAAPAVTPTAVVTPTVTVTSTASAGGADLVVTGAVEQELTLSEADLRAMEVVKITAEHPKKGTADYEGVRLSTLLDRAKLKSEAKKLVTTSDDGFVAEVFLAEVRSCADCLVAFTSTPGKFNLVMPGLPSSVWAKSVVRIEIK
jgi:DMSO/TMAO reductase YedYZ molybdopterin-dependent catalytic subunit